MRKYLCPHCWEMLPVETRRRLYLKDAKAMERLMVLHDQLDNHVPLDCIVVPV